MKKIILSTFIFSIFVQYTYSQTLQPDDSNAVINISVVDHDNKPITGEKVTIQSVKTGKVYSGITNADGKFPVLVPYGCDYTFKYQEYTKDTAYGKKLPIPPCIDKTGVHQRFTLNFTLHIQLPKTYTLKNVFFDTGKSTLRAESNKELNELAEFLGLQKTMVIEVAGYTDNVGQDDANQKLSEARANAVRDYLLKKGIAGDKVSAKGYGASDPVAPNDSPEGRQQNRRTEVHILKS